ncbi:hypothetical protein B0T26DRAFT_641378 [Lasiosphaeria miniovina]|uniref:PHD-type domain-containing protein n=1 Tax=Lasiosphaeria miniovina TaxID=1954250 RepID=A0AA40AU23_9PEZI|nr:uncharacterized protein B0T26DRAFT_641378 [Lasiosphaeria miniovina]KAK0722023.1 hypothetical protein B0T26DRAFT_641378 [Lasiosphaeria miniovina]
MADPHPPRDGAELPGRDGATRAPPALSLPSGEVPAPAPRQASESSFSPTRPPYIPQFTAATQMILKRMKGEPSSLSSALSAASPSMTADIKPATYEDVKRRLVMSMNTSTSMTMQMPVAAPSPSPSPVVPIPTLAPPVPMPTPPRYRDPNMSAIRRISSGLSGPGKLPSAKAAQAKFAAPVESKPKKLKALAVPKASGVKRKRVKGADDDASSSLSSLTDLSDREPPATNTPPAVPLTMTKSGRQVQKPMTYNPAAMDTNTKKRAQYGKRTAQQALCKKCTRMHSPASNQMVFCDGCNDGWHQMCHEPWIDDEAVRDQSRAWFCATCQAKRERHLTKKQRIEPRPKESWAGKTPQQKRAYLSTLPQQDLVGLLMNCLDLHPDLPIFPASAADASPNAQGMPRLLFAGSTTEGLFPRSDANPIGQINFVRKAATNNARQERPDDEDDEFDPLAPLWPKPGMGLYSKLPPDADDDEHLVDDDDYEAFSVIMYNEKGQKVRENGMDV